MKLITLTERLRWTQQMDNLRKRHIATASIEGKLQYKPKKQSLFNRLKNLLPWQ